VPRAAQSAMNLRHRGATSRSASSADDRARARGSGAEQGVRPRGVDLDGVGGVVAPLRVLLARQ
jgi:hypothetical protein